MAGNKCLWCNLPSIDRYCKPHLKLGRKLDQLDERIGAVKKSTERDWNDGDEEEFDRLHDELATLLDRRNELYRKLSAIEPEVGDDIQ